MPDGGFKNSFDFSVFFASSFDADLASSEVALRDSQGLLLPWETIRTCMHALEKASLLLRKSSPPRRANKVVDPPLRLRLFATSPVSVHVVFVRLNLFPACRAFKTRLLSLLSTMA